MDKARPQIQKIISALLVLCLAAAMLSRLLLAVPLAAKAASGAGTDADPILWNIGTDGSLVAQHWPRCWYRHCTQNGGAGNSSKNSLLYSIAYSKAPHHAGPCCAAIATGFPHFRNTPFKARIDAKAVPSQRD